MDALAERDAATAYLADADDRFQAAKEALLEFIEELAAHR